MELGEAAVLADSTNPEAYYQAVHAVGRYAMNVGTLTALRRGFAGRIRDLLDAALDHDFAEAHMALAGWHADIHSAGRVARFMYGGNRVNAVIHYERALHSRRTPRSCYSNTGAGYLSSIAHASGARRGDAVEGRRTAGAGCL